MINMHTQNNELIAGFMGGYIISESTYTMPHGSSDEGVIQNWKVPSKYPTYLTEFAKIGNFNYHSDWNCLMPVIDRIEELGYESTIEKESFFPSYRAYFTKNAKTEDLQGFGQGKSRIESIYKSVVEFIKKHS